MSCYRKVGYYLDKCRSKGCESHCRTAGQDTVGDATLSGDITQGVQLDPDPAVTSVQADNLKYVNKIIIYKRKLFSFKGKRVSPPHPSCCFPVWLWSRPACPLGPQPGTGTRSPMWSAAARSCALCRCTRCQSDRPWYWLAGARPLVGSRHERAPPFCLCTGRGSGLLTRRTSVSTVAYPHWPAAERRRDLTTQKRGN